MSWRAATALALVLGFGSVPGGAAEPAVSWSYTKAQALRGKVQYQTHCARCHMETLEGNGPALPLAGDAFLSRWGNQSVYDLLVRVRTTMPQDRPNSLGERDYLDIVAYLLRANEVPAGADELGSDPESLKRAYIVPVDGQSGD